MSFSVQAQGLGVCLDGVCTCDEGAVPSESSDTCVCAPGMTLCESEDGCVPGMYLNIEEEIEQFC